MKLYRKIRIFMKEYMLRQNLHTKRIREYNSISIWVRMTAGLPAFIDVYTPEEQEEFLQKARHAQEEHTFRSSS